MLGLVTIGQSPRDDIVDSMFRSHAEMMIIEAGALDGLCDTEIARLAPGIEDHVLVTRLRSGGEAVIGKDRILGLLQQAVDIVVGRGATMVCVLCTGAFPALRCSVPIVFPDRLMVGILGGMFQGETLGVVIPHDEQADTMRAKWGTAQRRVVTATFSPYFPDDRLEQAVLGLRELGVSAIVMDCMGYDREMAEAARRLSGLTVMLANGLVGAVLSEMAGLSPGSRDQAE